MKAIFLIGAAGLTFAGTTAHAQDLSGFRLEARVGWEQSGTKAAVVNPDDDEDEVGDELLVGSEKDSGVAYGFEAGYDALFAEGVLVGAYAGLDLSDRLVCSELFGNDLVCVESGRTFTLGVRGGVPIGSRSLVFVKGGYSNGKFDLTYSPDLTDNDDEEPGEILGFSEKQDGYHLGAGAEFGLSQNIYVKVEYVYTDFGGDSYLFDEDEDTSSKVQSDRHQALLGIGMRF